MSLRFLDSSLDSVIEALREPGGVNIVFGAGRIGEMVFNAARAFDVPITAFCDNNPEGRLGTEKCGIRVMKPHEAAEEFPAARYFVAMMDRLPSVYPQLAAMNLDKRCLTPGIAERAVGEGKLPGIESVPEPLAKAVYLQKTLVEPDALFLSEISLFVDEHCTLRCRDCTHRIPYFDAPRRPSLRELLESLDAFLGCVDGVYNLSLTGGDAFMRPDISELVSSVLERKKIGRVGVFTNAILPFRPEKWAPVKGANVYFRVTDYRHPRQNVAGFFRDVEAAGFKTWLERRETWTQVLFHDTPLSDEARNRKVFRDCILSTCSGLNGFRLYRCPLVGVAIRQNLLPDDPDGYVDLSAAAGGRRIPETRAAIRHLFFGKESMRACASCGSRILGLAPVVEPGVQA